MTDCLIEKVIINMDSREVKFPRKVKKFAYNDYYGVSFKSFFS